jgi:hypothetical protein
MANPRNIKRYNDQHFVSDGYKHDGTIVFDDEAAEGNSAQVGLAVTLTADDTVSLAGDGEFVLGKLLLVESDGHCSVQIGGYMHLPRGTGATLTRGKKIVGDLGPSSAEGYIREVATGTAAELGVARGWIQNNAGANNDDVLVFLEAATQN